MNYYNQKLPGSHRNCNYLFSNEGFCNKCGKFERHEKMIDALEFAKMTIEHALFLDYCGEGSTKGMCEDAVKKIEEALK